MGEKVNIPTSESLLRNSRGFTLLELAVVVSLVGILFTVAVDKYLDLLVDVERATMEQNLGAMRSAVAIQMAARIARGDMAGVAALAGTNPMAYMAETPFNYLGELDGPEPGTIEGGSWYFDIRQSAIVYRVKNVDYFETPLGGPTRALFRIAPVFDGIQGENSLAGLSVRPMEPYRWLKEPIWRE